MIRGLSFVLILLVAGYAAAQSCTQRLNRAEDLFDAGRLLEVEVLISKCISDGSFSEGELVRARKLLTKVAIFTDNEPKAEEELVNLLIIDPVHELQPEDPSEMTVLMNKFRTWPIYRIEVYAGGNMAFTGMAQSYSAFTSDASEKEYGKDLGFVFGARITKHLRYFVTGLEVGAGFEYRATGYSVVSSPRGGDLDLAPTDRNPFETNLTNSQVALRLPLFARYNFNYGVNAKFTPYVFAGVTVDYYLAAEYSEASRSGGTSVTISDSPDNDLKAFNQINDLNTSLILGGGAKFRAGKGNFFFVEARFDKGLALYNVPEERYANQKINGDLMFVEDDVFLNFIGINFGYVKSIFKPEKLTK